MTDNQSLARETIEKLVREEWGRLLAALIAHLGDFQLAEDTLHDAAESALVHWQRNGLPRAPVAWLLQTARRKAIDRLRRQANFKSKSQQISFEHDLNQLIQTDANEMAQQNASPFPDERLALIFTCCHPALDEKSRTALTLHTLGGLTTPQIARAFLDSEYAMAQRLVRAKRKIKQANIPYIVPEPDQWPERLQTVLGVLYLIFNEGYFATSGEAQIRVDLSEEALRLTRILLKLKPAEAETEGLLALMLLHDSRRAARYDPQGNMVALEDQDRNRWNQDLIKEGLEFLERALMRQNPGPYQVQSAISACHAEAINHQQTNWLQIVHLYEELYRHQPNPVVELNRIVAVSYATSPERALLLLSSLEAEFKKYQPFFAVQADILARVGDFGGAETAYLKAIDLSGEEKTRHFLEQKLGRMLRAN